MHPDKFELVPRQNETAVTLPRGLTNPFTWVASEVTLLSVERDTSGGASVVKLRMSPEAKSPALNAAALK